MKGNKVLAGILTSALVLGAFMGTPLAATAKSKNKDKQESKIDWGIIDVERLAKNLVKQGVIDEDASPSEVQRAITRFVGSKSIPTEIDTTSKFGQKANKGKLAVTSQAIKKANKITENSKEAKFRDVFKDNIVMALVQFPDLDHNKIPYEESNLWTEDFNHEHYENMLFNPYGYRTPEGIDLITMAQYYYEQSGGSWSVDGAVTPWVNAEHDEAFYGGNDENGNDVAPRELVEETLAAVGEAIQGHEDKYDQRDPYDIDGDGKVMEPDGMLDNLMIVHAGVGEETGERDQAIWSHRSTLETPTKIPGTNLKAYDYMVQPEDGAVGVFAHEYGHNLGLPDLYDTVYGGLGSPVGSWSIMSSGSWNGKYAGTEPTAFDPWDKLVLQATYGGNWIKPKVIDQKDIKTSSKRITLDEGVSMDPKNKALKITLPQVLKEPVTKPNKGKYSYFSDRGDELNTKMTSETIDLSGAKEVELSFDAWRQIETGYDVLNLNIIDADNGEYLKKEFKSWDDDTKGWTEEKVDLSEFAGKKIKLEFNYVTDGGLALEGFYSDNFQVKADGNVIFEDDAEDEPKFDLKGFELFDGSGTWHDAYYLVEYRTHNGVDKGLATYGRGEKSFSYDPGLVIWYFDGRYEKGADNHTGAHPGEGFLGVVDAHQEVHYWNGDKSKPATDRYQVNDAAFSLHATSGLDYVHATNGTLKYKSLPAVKTFYDKNDYSLPGAEDVGKILQKLGIQIKVVKENKSGTQLTFDVSKKK